MTYHPTLMTVFERDYADLLRYVDRRFGVGEASADVVQETYLRVANLPADTIVDNARAFIFRIAANLALDGVRRSRRFRVVADVSEQLADPAPTPEALTDARQRLRRLNEALSALPEKPRKALILFRVEGLTHSEIAERLGVSNSMVAKYLAQAVRHCREAIRQLEGPNV